MNREKTVCFTGHREIRKNDRFLSITLYHIVEELILNGFTFFCSGGARGFDTLAEQTVLKLKEKYPHIHLILILPFCNPYTKESGWNKEDIQLYLNIKEKATKSFYVQQEYKRGCYYKRDRWLVDSSWICVCYQYRNTGGTAYTTQYAKKNGIQIINCVDTDPESFHFMKE